MHTNTSLPLSHTHLLTLILALSLTAECLMTLRGGTGESSRYNMLDEIQAFSIPRACWKTICILIHGGCVWSHKQKQKGNGHMEAYIWVCVGLSLCFTVHALPFLYMQINLHLCHSPRLRCQHIGRAEHICSTVITLLYLSNCSSIHAADLYPSGSAASDLDKYIPSQETKAIRTSCSLLALDQ